MNKIKVIKKGGLAVRDELLEFDRRSTKPTKRELVEVVGSWVADWKSRTEIETRRAWEECARFRLGSSLGM